MKLGTLWLLIRNSNSEIFIIYIIFIHIIKNKVQLLERRQGLPHINKDNRQNCVLSVKVSLCIQSCKQIGFCFFA